MRPRLERLGLRELEWLSVAAPLVFLAAVYYVVLGPIHPIVHSWFGFLALAVVLTAATLLFSRMLFGRIRALQEAVEALHAQSRSHNHQLVSLQGANLALMRETRVVDALRRSAELGATLVGACHASLAVHQPSGAGVTYLHPPLGDAATARCAIEAAALGGQALSDRRDDARLISVPLSHLGAAIGTLRLARARDAEPFTETDQEVARMFATHAALVVQNDRLFDEVRALAIEGERQALAREMHDGLAQVLAFVNTKAQAVELYLRNADVTSARQQMAELSAAAREVYADILEGISALRVAVSSRSLGQLIEDYAREFIESAGPPVRVEWRVDDRQLELPPAAEVQLLRIVQEALRNVRRQAGARQARVEASLEDAALVLLIEDDGRGFDAAGPADGRPRFGLQTMAERAQAIGGTLTVRSAPETGTRIRVTVPVGRPADTGDEA